MPYIGGIEASAELVTLATVAKLARLRALRPFVAGAAGTASAALLADLPAAAGARAATVSPGLGGVATALTAAIEEGRRIRDLAARATALPWGSPGRRRIEARLFAAVASTPFLLETAPHQTVDRGFAGRARRLGERLLEQTWQELPVALAAHAVGGVPGARFAIAARENPDLALAGNEIALGGTPWLLRLSGSTAEPATIAIENTMLELRLGGELRLRLPLAALTETRAKGVALLQRPRIEGSPTIRLGRRLRSTSTRLRVGAPVPGLERKLGTALALLGRVWLEAWQELHLFTELVVPLAEPGTVSYSLPARPGISYINVWEKSLLQLTDDLLHEAAHHKLHAVEALEPLVESTRTRGAGAGNDTGDAAGDAAGDDRLWSPWRESYRPLRGLVHACYTFSYGALLFAHLLASRDPLLTPARLRFARERLLEEDANLEFAIAEVARAERRRQRGGGRRARDTRLAAAGRELWRELQEVHQRAIRPAARRAERELGGGDPGSRSAHRRILALRAALAAREGVEPGTLTVSEA